MFLEALVKKFGGLKLLKRVLIPLSLDMRNHGLAAQLVKPEPSL
jgi:hypothetical protein